MVAPGSGVVVWQPDGDLPSAPFGGLGTGSYALIGAGSFALRTRALGLGLRLGMRVLVVGRSWGLRPGGLGGSDGRLGAVLDDGS